MPPTSKFARAIFLSLILLILGGCAAESTDSSETEASNIEAAAEAPKKLAEIASTYRTDDNVAVIDFLSQNDGKRIYLDTVNADLSIEENSQVVNKCFPAGDENNETALDGELNGKPIPIPTPAEGEDCYVFFQIEANSDRAFPTSHGGTGIVNIIVRKHFLVNKLVSGATTVFNLREVD